jgi:hypothetical protein
MKEDPMDSEPLHEVPWLLKLKLPALQVQVSQAPPPGPAGKPPFPAAHEDTIPKALPNDTLGLALSGGGIRSATFCLGVLQSLARAGWLRWVDYLSTVSGGGYIGAFLGRFFDLCYKPGGLTGAVPNRTAGAAQDRVRRELSDGNSAPVRWLRQHSNYLSPTGLGEAITNFAGFWRNLLSVHLVLAFFFLALFGVSNAIGYGIPREGTPSLLWEFGVALTPIYHILPVAWVGAWAAFAEITLWVGVLPLIVAYWLVSQDLPEAFIAPVLVVAALLAVSFTLITSSPLSLVVLAAAVSWALAAWAAVRKSEGHADPFNRFRLLLARNVLTRWLAFWMGAISLLAALALIDALGRWLARLMLGGGLTAGNVAAWFVSVGSIILGLAGALRMLADVVVKRTPSAPRLLMLSRPYLWTVLILLLGAFPTLVAFSFASQATYEVGEAYSQGLAVTAGAVVINLLLGSRPCVPFINRSGPLMIYADRLARAFLGAVNPERRLHPDGRSVTHVVPGDDVSFDQYKPHEAGGPLHLINCAVNESVDVASQRGLRDRQAENLAVGPAGVTVAQHWHALWTQGPSGAPSLSPLAAGGGPHPFLGPAGSPIEVEPLDLRVWTAISGAVVSPGMGRATGPARALLFTLANLRLGYWWNSGLAKGDRQDVPVRRGLWPSIASLVSRLFRAQALLLSELVGRFGGPWYRYWYLSDGGNFEITGAYELLRRRVPFVIVCDAGQDRDQSGEDLGRLIRLARVDFGAEVEDPDPASLQQAGVPQSVADYLGGMKDLFGSDGQLPRRHAALLLVRYPDGPRTADGDPWLGRSHTWLLYLKSSLTGDEPADLRNYAALHPDFPNDTTLDQVFDEPQWESYRKLGEHIGDNLFVNLPSGAS